MITVDFNTLKKSGNKPGWYNGICPNCGKRKFYINIVTGQYICFRESCNIKGSIKEKDDKFILVSECDEDLSNKVKGLFQQEDSNPVIDLDKFSIPLSEVIHPLAYMYMVNRGFTKSDFKKYKIRAGIKFVDEQENFITKWDKRIVFPYFEDNQPLYAIGRSYDGKLPKYLNTQLSKSIVLYNHENIRDKVIVCEGLLSAIAAERYSGITAVPILGVNISDYQAFLISRAKDVFISLDGGVNPYKIANKLKVFGCNLYHVNMPDGKDPDELREDYLTYFKSAKPIQTGLINRLNHLFD